MDDNEIKERAKAMSNLLIRRASEINYQHHEKLKLLEDITYDVVSYLCASLEESQRNLFIIDFIDYLEKAMESDENKSSCKVGKRS